MDCSLYRAIQEIATSKQAVQVTCAIAHFGSCLDEAIEELLGNVNPEEDTEVSIQTDKHSILSWGKP